VILGSRVLQGELVKVGIAMCYGEKGWVNSLAVVEDNARDVYNVLVLPEDVQGSKVGAPIMA
jgi:hypothetical protein